MSKLRNEEIEELREILKDKANRDITGGIETDKEFFYTIGQCINFMVARYVKVNFMLNGHSVAKPALSCKDSQTLKKRTNTLYRKTNNMLYMEDKKFNNAYAMVLGYIPENSKVDNDLLELGFMEKCILK